MKFFSRSTAIFLLAIGLIGGPNLFGAETSPLNVGVVNFKVCVEKSKHGQQEKNAYEALKKQMSSMLEKAGKELEDIAKKLEDQDYMDGLSPAAEEELKQKYQTLSQDYSRYQNQYMQMLNQANYKVMQSLHLYVSKASENIAKSKNLPLVFSEESVFYYDSILDITQDVIAEMDRRFEIEHGDNQKEPVSN